VARYSALLESCQENATEEGGGATSIFDTSPEGPELEGEQVEIKSKPTRSKKPIRQTCPVFGTDP